MMEDQLNQEAEHAQSLREKKRAALYSLLAACLLTGLKIVVGVLTNSLGVLAEAAHSALDLVAAGVTYFAIRISAAPPDRRHTYGHGKVENLSALIETLLLLFTCGWIVHEAIQRLFFLQEGVHMSFWAIGVMLFSMIIDFSRSRHLSHMAKKHHSQALEADALHFSTDILSSAVVIVGLGAVWLAGRFPVGSLAHSALSKADAVAALTVACIVAWVSLRLGRKALGTLLDAGDCDKLAELEKTIRGIPEVLRLTKLRLRESGPATFVDMNIVLPAHYSLESAHQVTDKVEKAVRDMLPGVDVTVHFEPETSYNPEDFLSRVHQAAQKHNLEVHAVEVFKTAGSVFINLHAEVDGQESLASAHARVAEFEKEFRREGCYIFTHIEPVRGQPQFMASQPAAKLGTTDVSQAIAQTIALEENISSFHQVRLLETQNGTRLSFHCYMPGSLTVSECHNAISRVEHHLHKLCPQLYTITIHTDPLVEEGMAAPHTGAEATGEQEPQQAASKG